MGAYLPMDTSTGHANVLSARQSAQKLLRNVPDEDSEVLGGPSGIASLAVSADI